MPTPVETMKMREAWAGLLSSGTSVSTFSMLWSSLCWWLLRWCCETRPTPEPQPTVCVLRILNTLIITVEPFGATWIQFPLVLLT